MKDFYETSDRTLVDILLDEQKAIETPVGRLSEEAYQFEVHGKGPVYESLVPLSAPAAGYQYAFQIDLDRCSGCKACVTACHSLNGLDEDETWRDVGTLIGKEAVNPFQQTITSACHHCVDPACMYGCPVNAYEKDVTTGIVLHLDDQCIGCQYCILKCPYDVPKYNAKRGIVRKCDMCHSRLANGEAPACVEACPHEAIQIGTVNSEECRLAAIETGTLVPSAPDSNYTIPSSAYLSAKKLPETLIGADLGLPRIQPTHWPLVLMLVLTQFGIGGFCAFAYIEGQSTPTSLGSLLWISWLALHVGLLASVAHLGKPLKAWRIFLGIRRSWLSREALAFGAISMMSSALVAISLGRGLGIIGASEWVGLALGTALCSTIVFGGFAIFCSAFLYHDTRRKYWRLSTTVGKFAGTTLLGALAFALIFDASNAMQYAIGLGCASAVKIGIEFSSLRFGSGLSTSTRLASDKLSGWWRWRLIVAILGTLLFSAGFLVYPNLGMSIGILITLLSGEILERVLFFKAVDAPKMPGGFN